MSESPPPNDVRVVIAVVRTGGIANIRRRWRVEAEPPDADDWMTLVERCPWNTGADAKPGADRFVWSIRVLTPSEQLERELTDSEIDGPWRALVDAVRDASRRDDGTTTA